MQQFLPQIIRKSGLQPAIDGATVCRIAGEILRELCEPEICASIKPISFHERILLVGVPSSAFAEKVHMIKEKLIEALQKRAGLPVERIKISLTSFSQ